MPRLDLALIVIINQAIGFEDDLMLLAIRGRSDGCPLAIRG